MVSAHCEKGSTGPGVGIAAIVESAQATQASQVDAEIVAEDLMTEEALADVMTELNTAEELLATDPLDGATEEPTAELPEIVGDGCVTDGWLADGFWSVG